MHRHPHPTTGLSPNARLTLLALAVVALGISAWRGGGFTGPAAAPPATDLKHFDGIVGLDDKPASDHAQYDLYVRASRALEAGDAAAAEALYRTVTAQYPGDPGGHASLGASLYFQRRHAEAEAAYRRALGLDPRSHAALYGLGSVAYAGDRFGEARGHLRAALEVRAEDALTHRLLGLVEEELGDRASAAAHYRRAVDLRGDGPPDATAVERLAALGGDAGHGAAASSRPASP